MILAEPETQVAAYREATLVVVEPYGQLIMNRIPAEDEGFKSA